MLLTPIGGSGIVRERLEQALAQHPELKGVEDLVDLGALERLARGVRERHWQRHVRDKLGQRAVGLHLADVRTQGLPHLALDLVGVTDQLRQAAVLADPLRGGLLPDARDRGQVVTRVAAQRCEVRVLLRGEAVLRQHCGRRHAGQV